MPSERVVEPIIVSLVGFWFVEEGEGWVESLKSCTEVMITWGTE